MTGRPIDTEALRKRQKTTEISNKYVTSLTATNI